MAHLGFGNTCGSASAAVDALFTRNKKSGAFERDIGDGLCVVRVTEDSPLLPAVIDIIARSECGSTTTAPDPLLDWVYAPRKEDVYEPLETEPSKDRQDWFRWFATYSVYFGIARNGTYALVDQASRQVKAAAVTGPPGTVEFGRMSTGEMEQNLRRAGMNLAIEILVKNQRNKALGMWQSAAQNSACLGKHLYILFFDTAPEWQGRGCGGTLLRFLGDVADVDGVESFLETAGKRNTTFYARKGGFEEVARSPVASFDHDGGGVAMRRSPRRSAAIELKKVSAKKEEPRHAFAPKRPTGPLSNRCGVCGVHKDMH